MFSEVEKTGAGVWQSEQEDSEFRLGHVEFEMLLGAGTQRIGGNVDTT